MSGKRIKKSVMLPLALGLYATAMTLYFGPRLIEEGMSLKLWLSVGLEALVVVGLFFALRRKERLASNWPDKLDS